MLHRGQAEPEGKRQQAQEELAPMIQHYGGCPTLSPFSFSASLLVTCDAPVWLGMRPTLLDSRMKRRAVHLDWILDLASTLRLMLAPFEIKVLSPIRFFDESQMYSHEVSHHPHRARSAPNHLKNFSVIV